MAKAREVANARFQVASVYELPFPDKSFDAVFAHGVLEHLREPLKALTEMRRVLKQGGVIGIRDADQSAAVWPDNEEILAHRDHWNRLWKLSGDPFIGKKLKPYLVQSGFIDVIGSASYRSYGTPEATRRFGDVTAGLIRESRGPQIIEQGWATQEEIDAAAEAFEEWGRSPEAFFAVSWCEAVGWKE